MHELSLAGGILRIVEDAALREGFARVTMLRIEAGALAGVEPHALRFALEVIAQNTCLQDATIEIDTPSAHGMCDCCEARVEMTSYGDACPSCGACDLRPLGKQALRVLDMMVEDD